MIFDESGERLTPSHAVKKGTRYRYYVSRSLISGQPRNTRNGRRIPAANLETLVVGRTSELFSSVMREQSSTRSAMSTLAECRQSPATRARASRFEKRSRSLTPDGSARYS